MTARGRARGPVGGCWPTREQEWLLRAALLRGGESLAAWEQWHARVDIEENDLGSYRLLPLLYRNLSAQRVTDSALDKIRGIYRFAWSKNQLLIYSALPLLKAFREAEIPVLLLKGAALGVACYHDGGTRPMDDVDVLVPEDRFEEAVRIVREAGWTTERTHGLRELPIRHAIAFERANRAHLDLHRHVFTGDLRPRTDDAFWEASVPARLGMEEVRVLSPADQLLHVCAHGVAWNKVPPIRWIADAMMQLRASDNTGDTLDWDRLVERARYHGYVIHVREALRYLRTNLGAPVPGEVIARLDALPVSARQRREYALHTAPETAGRRALRHYYRYLRVAESGRLHKPPFGFPRYLQHYWRLESLWQVPVYCGYRVARRIQRR